MDRPIDPITKEFKRKVKRLYGARLKAVVLYGSWARNTANEGSDIDLLVVLAGRIRHPGREIDRMMDIIFDLGLKHDTLLSVVPVSHNAFLKRRSPLLINVRREGVAV